MKTKEQIIEILKNHERTIDDSDYHDAAIFDELANYAKIADTILQPIDQPDINTPFESNGISDDAGVFFIGEPDEPKAEANGAVNPYPSQSAEDILDRNYQCSTSARNCPNTATSSRVYPIYLKPLCGTSRRTAHSCIFSSRE